jgi:OmpA-OmpF porin, OOP family
MRMKKAFLPLVTLVAFAATSVGVSACHAQAKVAIEAPPPPPPPPEPPPPPPPPKIKMKSATQIDLPGNIDFDSGKASIKLTDQTKMVLTAVLEILKDNAQITTLSIEGNTDNAGEPKFDNTKLSQDRAASVVAYLVDKGVDRGRLAAVGYGSSHPLVTNDSPDHMALNRRVEFHILGLNGRAVPKEPRVYPPSVGAKMAPKH